MTKSCARKTHKQRRLTNDSQEHLGSTHYTKDHHEQRHPAANKQKVSTSLNKMRKHANENNNGRNTGRQDEQHKQTHSGLTRHALNRAIARQQSREHAFRHSSRTCHDHENKNERKQSARSRRGHTQEQCTTQQHTHLRNSHREPPAHCQSPTTFNNHKRRHHTDTHNNEVTKQENKKRKTSASREQTKRHKRRNKNKTHTPPRHYLPTQHPKRRERVTQTQHAGMTGQRQGNTSVCVNSTDQNFFHRPDRPIRRQNESQPLKNNFSLKNHFCPIKSRKMVFE